MDITFVKLFKDRRLGVEVTLRVVEEVSVDADFFARASKSKCQLVPEELNRLAR